MRITVCDDDVLFTEQLTACLQEFFKRNNLKCPIIDVFHSGEELLQDSHKKDIVFLDVEMPGINGISAGNKLKQKNKNVLLFIITSYSEYLDEAMRVHVFRYLSKPLEKQRFFRNMKDALHTYSISNVNIPVETKDGIYTLNISDIVSVEAFERKVIIHTTRSDYESIHTMADWLQRLPENCFFQTHRSFIVNLTHVTNFDHSLINLNNGHFKAYLTRRKYTEFKAAYLLYLESMR